MKTERIAFSAWDENGMTLAKTLWGQAAVTKYICKTGVFTDEDIKERLATEIENGKTAGVQYWQIFNKNSGEFLGCCGLRPFKNEKTGYEIGFHLCEAAWGKGYATEAAQAVIDYAFKSLNADVIYAGRHPDNTASEKVLLKLGFEYIGDNYYAPTGLMHPSYMLKR